MALEPFLKMHNSSWMRCSQAFARESLNYTRESVLHVIDPDFVELLQEAIQTRQVTIYRIGKDVFGDLLIPQL